MTQPTDAERATALLRRAQEYIWKQRLRRELDAGDLCAFAESEIATARAEGDRHRLALESLTPGGSEYVRDPERRVAYVRDVQHSQHETIKRFKKQADEARAEGWRAGVEAAAIECARIAGLPSASFPLGGRMERAVANIRALAGPGEREGT